MATLECEQELRIYAEAVLFDPGDALSWYRRVEYTTEELPKPRAEMPIDIIVQAKGRCGEFELLYNGLLSANGYQTRIVVDCFVL